MGHIISSEGIRVDLPKLTQQQKCLYRNPLLNFRDFREWYTISANSFPNLAEVTAQLRTLLKKKVVFNLQEPQLDAIEKLKTLITSARALKIFDQNLPD